MAGTSARRDDHLLQAANIELQVHEAELGTLYLTCIMAGFNPVLDSSFMTPHDAGPSLAKLLIGVPEPEDISLSLYLNSGIEALTGLVRWATLLDVPKDDSPASATDRASWSAQVAALHLAPDRATAVASLKNLHTLIQQTFPEGAAFAQVELASFETNLSVDWLTEPKISPDLADLLRHVEPGERGQVVGIARNLTFTRAPTTRNNQYHLGSDSYWALLDTLAVARDEYPTNSKDPRLDLSHLWYVLVPGDESEVPRCASGVTRNQIHTAAQRAVVESSRRLVTAGQWRQFCTRDVQGTWTLLILNTNIPSDESRLAYAKNYQSYLKLRLDVPLLRVSGKR